MSVLYISNPFPMFFDKQGKALENGFIYVGEVNKNPETSPISVYFDAALTIPAPNPVRTINGVPSRNGTPAQIFTSSNCSMTVKDKHKNLIFNVSIVYAQNSLTVNVDTVEELRAIVGMDGQVTNTLGYYAIKDDGGNIYRYDSTSTATDDGGAVIKPTAISGAGRWIANQTQVINIKQWGIKNDGATDNTAQFQKLATYLSSLVAFNLFMPAGKYLNSTYFRVESTTLIDATVDAWGAEYIVTAPTPIAGAYFGITNTNKTGQTCNVLGLLLQNNRPTVRTSNCDMLGVKGFNNYYLDHIVIPCADNNGIVVGRADGTFTPNSIQIIAPVLGGYRNLLDSHARIGDTGIWMNSAARVTHITSPQINGTGDDGILIGHSESPTAAAGGCYITNCDLRNVSNGMSLSVPRGFVTGRITRTNNTGIWLHLLNNQQAADVRVSLVMEQIGYLVAGDIGINIIDKENPDGIFVYTGGAYGGNFDFTGSSIDGCLRRGIYIQPSTEYGGDISGIYGKMRMRKIGTREDATINSDSSVIYRTSAGDASCSNVYLDVDVTDTDVPLITWLSNATNNDNNLNFKIKSCIQTISAPFTSTALMNFQTYSTGKPSNVNIELDLQDVSFGQIIRYVGLTDNEQKQLKIYGIQDGASFDVSGDEYKLTNANNSRHLKRETFQARRDVGIGTVLAELDPNKSWMVEIVHAYGGAAKGSVGAYYKAYWSPNSGALGSSDITVVQDTVGTNTTGFEIAFNAANTSFTGGTLEARGKAAGFSAGSIRAVMIAQEITDFSSSAVS